MAGKACGFDLKQIQSIAGNAPEENVAPVEESVLEPVEEVKNVDPLLAASSGLVATFWRNLWTQSQVQKNLPGG